MTTTAPPTDPRQGKPSASNIHRLAACAGSHNLCRGLPDRPTADSDFGTMGHEYLAGRKKAEELTPECLDIAESCQKIEERLVKEWRARYSIPDDAEITVTRDSERLWIERHGEGLVSGVADVIYRHDDRALILDYKFLPGDHADSDENLQLRCLACLVDDNASLLLGSADVAIIQPLKTHSPTVCSYDVEGLRFAHAELELILTRAADPDAGLKTGDHCAYCRAKLICPALKAEEEMMLKLPEAKSLAVLTDEEVAMAREVTGRLKKRIAEVEAEAFARAQANPALWQTLGWTITDGAGKRKVTDVSTVANRLESAGASMNDIAAKCSISIKAVKEIARSATGLKGAALDKSVATMLDDCCAITTPKPSLKRIGSSLQDDDTTEE